MNICLETLQARLSDIQALRCIVPLKWTESSLRDSIVRSPYTPYSIYLRGTIPARHFVIGRKSDASECQTNPFRSSDAPALSGNLPLLDTDGGQSTAILYYYYFCYYHLGLLLLVLLLLLSLSLVLLVSSISRIEAWRMPALP